MGELIMSNSRDALRSSSWSEDATILKVSGSFPQKIISRLFESCIFEIWNPEDDLDNNCTLQVPIITFLVYTHTISYSHQISIPAQIIVLSRTMITLW